MNKLPFYRSKSAFRLFTFFCLLFSFSSCRTDRALYADQGDFVHELELFASNSSLDFFNPQTLEYNFGSALKAPPNSSLEIQYSFSVPPSAELKRKFKIELETENESWTIPMDFSFLDVPIAKNAVYHFAVPLPNNFNGQFKIKLTEADTSAGSGARLPESSLPVFLIHSMHYVNQWFGFAGAEGKYFATPYVSKHSNGSFLISVPLMTIERNNRNYQLIAEPLAAGKTASVTAGGLTFEATAEADKILITSQFISHNSRVVLTGDRISNFRLTPAAIPDFPAPIRSDTGLILGMPTTKWRNKDWELFRWDRFPSILIIDTVDYEMQDKLFKRLAFFVEKAGFRGRLSHDHEIADHRGWYANDYHAEDLARFFDAAHKIDFPLHYEEQRLKRILLNEGIIIQKGNDIVEGTGVIISISRESNAASRRLYMAHEGFHGIYHIDDEFKEFTRSRWEQLNPQVKKFFLAFMDFKEYDSVEEPLVIKEFKGYILHNVMSQIGSYFGYYLPGLLKGTEFQDALPPPAKNGFWSSLSAAFLAEAEALSAYVNKRWGYETGRTWMMTVK